MSEQFSFAEFPEYSKLFLDFVYRFPAVSAFYSPCGHCESELEPCIEQVLRTEYPRARVADVLHRQNAGYGAGAEALAQVERLRRPDTVAVVTGQQVGLFAGPLLTFYKALTAVKVARHLTEQGHPAVPIFWMPSEDHDFDEIATAYFLRKPGVVEAVRYDPGPAVQGQPVGNIRLDDSIRDRIAQVQALWPATEFTEDLLRDLAETYTPGTRMADAFARLLLRALGRYGLVVIDPSDLALKQGVEPLLEKVLREARTIDEAIKARDQALQAAGFHAQVRLVKSNTLIFYARNGRRVPIRMDGDRDFLIDGERFSETALLERLRGALELFSPNVLLRPFIQDALLPTAAYIGGPSEIAYYAQVQPLYTRFARPTPVILTRASFTLVPKKVRRILNKYRLSFQDVHADFDTVFKKVVETALHSPVPERFARAEAVLRTQLSELEAAIVAEEPPLASAVHHARDKMLKHLEGLKNKFFASSATRHEVARAQIQETLATLYPNQTSQERVLNGYTFFAKYGYGLLDRIYEAIALRTEHHTLLDLD